MRGAKIRKSPRKCRRCHQTVSAPEEIKPGGLVCLECQRKRSRKRAKQWYGEHRQAVIDRSVKWKREHPEKVREHRDAYLARVFADPDWTARYVEGRREAWREWKARKSLSDRQWVEARKAQQREAHRLRRIQQGLPVRPISAEEYRRRYGSGFGQSTRVPAEPVVPFLKVAARSEGLEAFGERAHVSGHLLCAVVDGRRDRISLVTADRICTALSLPMGIIYLEDEAAAA